MLAGDVAVAPWQNPFDQHDVNFDQRVSTVDALVIINDLLRHGSHSLAAPEVSPLAASSDAESVMYVDVNGDNRVTPVDLLIVVNELVDEELMSVRTIATDLAGDPISTIAVGEQYKLQTIVQDIRDPAAEFGGVFSANVDTTFNAALSSVEGAVEFDPFWNLTTDSSVSPGRVTGFGSTSTFPIPTGSDPQLLWNVVLTATNPGMQVFTPAFIFDIDQPNTLILIDDPLLEEEIQYIGSMLQITGPAVSIGNVSQAEDAGTPFNFEVTLSAPVPNEQVTVTFTTFDGTGNNPAEQSDNDYEFASGVVTFAPGETLQTIPVTVNSDLFIEADETFTVNLSSPSPNVLLGTAIGTGTILNDDRPPALEISDATATAGATPTVAVFTVSISGVLTEQVTVGFATEDDTALEGIDYEAATGILTFEPGGPTTQEIEVTVLSSMSAQADRSFFVNLSSQMPPEVILDDARGVGTIITQGISVSDVTVVEGNSSTTDAVFTVSLTQAAQEEVTVEYSTADGTATAGEDYVAKSETLTFTTDGPQAQTVTVQVNGDLDPEANEQFFLNLSNAVGARIFGSQGVGTILNDDGDKVAIRLEVTDESENPLPVDAVLDVNDEFFLRVFVQDVQAEPTGVAQAFLDVMYPSGLIVPVDDPEFGPFYTSFSFFNFEVGLLDDFGAFGMIPPLPSDFDPSAELLLFKQQFRATDVGLVNFVASVDEEDLNQGNETLLYLSDDPVLPEEINLLNDSVNIGANVIAARNTSAPESSNIVFEVTRFLPEDSQATVVYTTVDDTATDGADYIGQSGTLTFAAGQTEPLMVTVPVINDTTDEPDETFFLVLSDPVNAATSQSPATGTIEDDDGPVTVSVANGTASEGSDLLFTVSLSAESGKTVTVAFNTEDSSSGIMATAGVDYTPTSGVLTFEPGTVSKSVTVETLGDIEFEDSETFQLVISSPQNANLGTAQAQGTIIDVPPAGISGFVYVDLNDNAIKEGNETGISGVIVTATRESDGMTQSTVTGPNGFYALLGLVPGTYTISETQPGFYNDGRDARFGVESPVNDEFQDVVLAPSASETGYNFGEGGVRGEFVAAFINRRALFASATVSGFFDPTLNMEGTTLNLGTGEIWVSFDGGWDGLRSIEALFDSSQGSASMRLYNNDLQEIALSAPTAAGAVLLFNGQLGLPYFLRISGSNPNVVVQISDLPAPSSISVPAADGGGDDQSPNTNPPTTNSDELSPASRFASAQPMIAPEIEPLASADASDEALAEDEDWILETLVA